MILLFEATHALEIGGLVQVNRRIGGIEVPFALVHISEVNQAGHFQGKPVYAAPGHLRDFRLGTFPVEDMVVTRSVRTDQVREAVSRNLRALEQADE